MALPGAYAPASIALGSLGHINLSTIRQQLTGFVIIIGKTALFDP
jgi:hypothetical protein